MYNYNLWKLVLSFHYVGHKNETQVVGLGSCINQDSLEQN